MKDIGHDISIAKANSVETEHKRWRLIVCGRKFRNGYFVLFLLAILAPGGPAARIAEKSKPQNSLLGGIVLSPSDKEGLKEVLRLKAEMGDHVWPGLDRLPIPLILYNDQYEFLIGGANPPVNWEVVKGDDFLGKPYYRRAAENPQAFAVSLGTRWAASQSTLERMNRKIPLKLSPEIHVMLILHEVFHAFQATLASERFAKARAVYAWESRYPSKDAEFAAAWKSEGELLAEALEAKEDGMASSLVQKFLSIRDTRRRRANLDPALISFEQELEWLERLAKYVEIQFYELAASRSAEDDFARYRRPIPFWQWDFLRLKKNLGAQEGDLRFYLSGMAQARLLDRLSPGWKAKALEAGVFLEDMF
jgi:hypothetical protein